MKQLYRDMQKEQMKQLKAETHKEGTQRTEGKGFVSNCLIRVECEEEGEITVDSLRVSHSLALPIYLFTVRGVGVKY